MPASKTVSVEGIGGVALSLIAAALGGLGVSKIVWLVVLGVGVVLLALAGLKWHHERPRQSRETLPYVAPLPPDDRTLSVTGWAPSEPGGPTIYRSELLPRRSSSSKSGLKEQLMKELAVGMTLKERIPSVYAKDFLLLGTFVPKTTDADVIEWEDRVVQILKNEPRMQVHFMSELKTDLTSYIANFASDALRPALFRQIEHRLQILEKLISELE